ncbi:MAG: hypothetical protein U1D26_02615, partial [Patescibacteria group bacterium]|nr:hypothetical protein [Patescibacteria group bacterium]
SGNPETTGYGTVGPRTAAAISIVCSGGTYNGVSGTTPTTPAPVGGYISVTPVSGAAPLTVNVTATVNTADSCSGATYTLDFGDGAAVQNITVPSGNCSQLQNTYTHIYQVGGSYRILLSSGSHSTSATVTVSGIAPDPTPPTTPAGTISAFTTSGTAPFPVTFYVSCVAGLAYNVIFGDGQELGSSNVGNTTCNGSLQSVTHTYSSAGTYNAQLILFVSQPDGTVGTKTVGSVSVTVANMTPASGTLSASVSSGNAPLAVTFTGMVKDSSICAGGTYKLSYGDGQSNNVVTSQGGCTAKSFTFSHQYNSTGIYTAILVAPSGETLGTETILVQPPPVPEYSYNPPTLQSGGTSLGFTIQFDLPSSCTGYDLSWGDGTAHVAQSDGGSSCDQTVATKTLSHTYLQGGTFSIILKRGASLGRTDDISVTISN